MGFEIGRARLTDAAKSALAPLATALDSHGSLRVVLTAHPDKNEPRAIDLATRRAEAIKWWLVDDQGIVEDRVDTATGSAQPKASIEAALR